MQCTWEKAFYNSEGFTIVKNFLYISTSKLGDQQWFILITSLETNSFSAKARISDLLARTSTWKHKGISHVASNIFKFIHEKFIRVLRPKFHLKPFWNK